MRPQNSEPTRVVNQLIRQTKWNFLFCRHTGTTVTQEQIFARCTGRTQVRICAGNHAKLVGVYTQFVFDHQAIDQHFAHKTGVRRGRVIETGNIILG